MCWSRCYLMGPVTKWETTGQRRRWFAVYSPVHEDERQLSNISLLTIGLFDGLCFPPFYSNDTKA